MGSHTARVALDLRVVLCQSRLAVNEAESIGVTYGKSRTSRFAPTLADPNCLPRCAALSGVVSSLWPPPGLWLSPVIKEAGRPKITNWQHVA